MKNPIVLSIILGTSMSCQGIMYYTVSTDASANFIEGGYTGDGTVLANAGGSAAGETTIVENFSSGTIDLGRTAVAFDGFALLGGTAASNTPTPLGASASITLNGAGANADFSIAHQLGILGKPVIADMQNVTSFEVTWAWDEPIAAPLGGAPIAFGPFLTGLANITQVSLDVDLEFTGLSHTLDGVNAISGLPTTADAIDMVDTAASNTWATGSTSNSFTLAPGGSWEGIHGFDLNGGAFTGVWPSGMQGDGVLQDVEMVYATGFKATVSATSGATLPNGSRFIFSTNGNQWSDSLSAFQNIPEPSTSGLLGLSGLALLLRRRRY